MAHRRVNNGHCQDTRVCQLLFWATLMFFLHGQGRCVCREAQVTESNSYEKCEDDNREQRKQTKTPKTTQNTNKTFRVHPFTHSAHTHAKKNKTQTKKTNKHRNKQIRFLGNSDGGSWSSLKTKDGAWRFCIVGDKPDPQMTFLIKYFPRMVPPV